MSMKRFLTALLVASVAIACGRTAPQQGSGTGDQGSRASDPRSPIPDPSSRKYLLERVDDAAVVQLYADSFSALPLREKTLIWHLSQAAIAGRDIYIDQKHASALEMRGILDQIVAHPQGIDPAAFAEIQRYTKYFWINNGPYNNLTARKFVLKTTPEALAAAAFPPLRDPIPLPTEPMQNALRALIQWYRTGEQSDREKYDIAWVEDKASAVDTINGFIEVYLDPRGIKGSWEALVFSINPEKTETIRKLADTSQWFQDHSPADPKYHKPNVKGIIANAIDVIVETGDSGPVTPVGINLPNDQSIREESGST